MTKFVISYQLDGVHLVRIGMTAPKPRRKSRKKHSMPEPCGTTR